MKNSFSYSLFLYCIFSGTCICAQEISSFAICKKVESLEPVGITNHYETGDRAYAWMKVEGIDAGSTVFIDWYAEDILEHTSKMKITSDPMRTYAYKTLYKRGIWKVMVRTFDNAILKEATITVGAYQ
ncbi:MAG: DUF2914 domain-containing protein [Cyclobacteriaceae bacterium]